MPFGYLLKRFRAEKGLSQRKLAERAEITHSYVIRLENRMKGKPSDEIVQKLVDALGLGDREGWLLGFVAEFRRFIDVGMVECALRDPTITLREFSYAVCVKFREPWLNDDYTEMFRCAREFIKTVDHRRKLRNSRSNSAGA